MDANPRQKYPFLELITETEAVQRGANLSEKINYAVFKEIQSRSTSADARRNNIFTLDVEIPNVVNLTRRDLATVVQRLMGDQVVAQIYRLEYEPGELQPRLVPCYITRPEDERDTVYHLYSETQQRSVAALESFIDAQPQVTEDALRRDFAKDLASERPPPPEEFPSSLIELFSGVHASKFDILPPPELVQRSVADLREELLRKNRVVELLNYGLMPLREGELLTRLESAQNFLIEQVIPQYKRAGGLKRELEEIRLEEQAYYLEPHVPSNPEFSAKRAEAIKKAAESAPGFRGGRYPGALAVETVRVTAPPAKQRYQERFQQEMQRRCKEMRDALLRPSSNWKENIQFYTEAEKDELPAEVWKELTRDAELIYDVWHRRDGRMHCLAPRDPAAFRTLVRGMSELPDSDAWKALAMRQLLEQLEKNDNRFEELFEDPEFLSAYGRMLRRVYIRYMPWYYRLLIQMGLRLFQDRSFQVAKQAIAAQQRQLSERNDERLRQYQQSREEERRRRIQELREVSFANRVLEILDRLYFEERVIPGVTEVREMLNREDGAGDAPDSAADFRERLQREGFQILAPTGKSGGSDPQDAILLYPLNHEWRSRAARLRRVLDRIMESRESSGAGNRDAVQLARAKRVSRHLDRAARGGVASLDADDAKAPGDASASAAQDSAEDPDAYERFGRELDKRGGEDRRQAEREAAANANLPGHNL